MNNTEYNNIIIEAEGTGNETETAEAYNTDPLDTVNKVQHVEPQTADHFSTQQDLDEHPVSCFHSIFGGDYPDWARPTDETAVRNDALVSTEDSTGANWEEQNATHKITISDLKEEKFKNLQPGYRIVYNESNYNDIDVDYKGTQPVFDATSSRVRFKCPHCYFLTDNRGNLKQHMKIHEKSAGGTKARFQCEFCSFSTKYKNSIQGHVERHDKPTIGRGRKKGNKNKSKIN